MAVGAPVEALPDRVLEALGDAGPGIVDLEGDGRPDPLGACQDRGLAVAQGVGEQVHQYLVDPPGVGVGNGSHPGLDRDLRPGLEGQGGHRLVEQPPGRAGLPIEGDGRRPTASRVDDVGDHPGEVRRLLLDVVNHLPALVLAVAVPFGGQQLGVALHRREGGSQVVRGGGQDGISAGLDYLPGLAVGHPLAAHDHYGQRHPTDGEVPPAGTLGRQDHGQQGEHGPVGHGEAGEGIARNLSSCERLGRIAR